MLRITVPALEMYDEINKEFITIKEQNLCLEHSLVSISKWESKWHKPYLSKEEKTVEETIDYIKCMTLTQNVKPDVYLGLSEKNLDDIADYINNPMTATWFNDDQSSRGSTQQVTSELIYYWMFSLHIPKECEKWHISRLMTLIRVFNAENQDSDSRKNKVTNDNIAFRRALNEARRKQLKSKG